MSEWRAYSIGEIASWQAGFAFPSNLFIRDGVPIVRMSDLKCGHLDLSASEQVPGNYYYQLQQFALREGDFLMGMSGSLGNYARVGLQDLPALLNQRVGRLILKSANMDYGFVAYSLLTESFKNHVEREAAGAAQKNISSYQIERFKFFCPISLDEQRRIAEILLTLAETIEQTEALIAKMQQVKAGLMYDLFTRGVTPDGHLRPSREQAPELYKDSPLGWIPQEWDCLTVDQLLANTACPMRSGPFGSALLKDELVEDGIPFLGIDNIFVERFLPSYRRFVSKWKFHELIRYSVYPRDVIITIMGTVGRCCVVPNDITMALSSKHLWTMSFDTELVLPELVCWQLNHARWVKGWFSRYSQGAVMEAIQSSTLRSLKLPVPPITEQNQIFDSYKSCSQRVKAEEEYLAKLNQQKYGLMHDLLTGQVRVPREYTRC